MPSPLFFLTLSLSLAHSIQVAADPSSDAWSRVWKPCSRDCSKISSPTEWAVYSNVEPNDPQEDDGGNSWAKRTNASKTTEPPKPTNSPKRSFSTSSETKTSTKTSKLFSLPSVTSASGCSRVGSGRSLTRRCWNKCDPGTGSPVGGDWTENEPWCWIAESASDSYANCWKQSDCPTDFGCAESWGCVVPLSGGCAPQGGNTGLAKTCWSSCNEKTGKRTNDKWEQGMPWCWLQNRRFARCDEDNDCSATTECVPDYWTHGGCNTKSKT